MPEAWPNIFYEREVLRSNISRAEGHNSFSTPLLQYYILPRAEILAFAKINPFLKYILS